MSNEVVYRHSSPRVGFTVYDDSDSVIDCSVMPSLTVQSEKDACDINNIVARAARDGFASFVSSKTPEWGMDVADVTDYKSALDFVKEAQDQFMQLPANVRARFDNDPGQFLDFVEDPANIEEGVKLGIYTSDLRSGSVSPAEPPEAPQGPQGGSGGDA